MRGWCFSASAVLWAAQAQAQAGALEDPGPALSEADRDDVCIARHRDAQAERKAGRLLAAHQSLRQCLAPECSPVLREDCARLLTEVEQDIPSVVFAAESEAGDLVQVAVYDGEHRVRSSLDGTALWLDPGQHHFTFHAQGRVPTSRSVILRVGERNRRISVWLDRIPPPQDLASQPHPVAVKSPLSRRTAPTLTYSLLGVGAALGVSGFWLGVSAKRAYADAEATCAPLCAAAVQEEIRNKSLAADGLFVLSGALVAWGAVRLFATDGAAKSTSLWLGPGRLRAQGSF